MKIKIINKELCEKYYEALGFSSNQWNNAIWDSCVQPEAIGSYIYARRKGTKCKKLYIILDKDNFLAIKGLDLTLDQWDDLRNKDRLPYYKELLEEYYEYCNEWRLVEF